MFNKLKNAVKQYAEDFTEVELKYEQSKKKVDENYIGTMYATQIGKIKDEYDDTVAKLKNTFDTSIDSAFAEINKKIKESVTADIGADAIAELNLIKDMDLAPFEIEGYFEKYSASPKAMKILCRIAERNGMKVVYVTVEDVLQTLKDLRAKMRKFKDTYRGDYEKLNNPDIITYENEILIEGTPINIAESVYNEFLKPVIYV